MKMQLDLLDEEHSIHSCGHGRDLATQGHQWSHRSCVQRVPVPSLKMQMYDQRGMLLKTYSKSMISFEKRTSGLSASLGYYIDHQRT
jgi:hypothetical protein